MLRSADARKDGATIFAYWVDDPQRYGVDRVRRTDARAVDRGKAEAAEIELGRDRALLLRRRTSSSLPSELKPSARGEYEITDLNNLYIQRGALSVERLGRGYAWLDAGTYDSLLEAAEFIRVLQRRQGQLIAAPEEIAFGNGWITPEQLKEQASKFSKTDYGARLLDNLRS